MKKALVSLWVKQNEMKRSVKERFHKALGNEEGQGMVEYGLIIALVAVVVIVALTTMGEGILAKFEEVNSNL